MIQEIPVLKRAAKIKSRDKDRVVIEHMDEEVLITGAGAEVFNKAAEYFNGSLDLNKIAEKISDRPDRVRALASELSRAGVLSFLPNEGNDSDHAFTMTGLEFFELHRKYTASWLRPVYEHPLWEKIITGKASRAQVIGFAFEKYHYIEGAHEHMAIAAANATPEMMPHLARHFIEEYSHGDIYRKGLKSLFPDDVILSSQPLPSTRALINFLSESAARSSFAYYAGNEVLQVTENTGEKDAAQSIHDFYSAMRRHYPYTDKLIDSFIAHTHADQKLGHESVFQEMCESIPPMNRREVSDAMNVARSMVEHLLLFMDGIDVWYATHDVMPRVPCSLLSE